jgi:hypothetical protein
MTSGSSLKWLPADILEIMIGNSMTTEAELKEKLHKIEALFSGPATTGERNAAQAGRE